jgi:hypothetical protein
MTGKETELNCNKPRAVPYGSEAWLFKGTDLNAIQADGITAL